MIYLIASMLLPHKSDLPPWAIYQACISLRISACSACPSFDHSLILQLQAVGPSACESHKTMSPKAQKSSIYHDSFIAISGFWVKIPAPKLCHFLFKCPSSLSRDNLPVAVLNKKHTAMICILMVQFGSLGQYLLSVSGATTPPSFIMPLTFSDAIMWW